MPFVVYALIALNVYAFSQELAALDIDTFIGTFAAIPYDITHNVVLAPPSPPLALLTILTAMFLHGSVLHIAFNMLFLFVFGPEVEYLCGHGRFLAFYLVAGIAGEIAQIASGPGSHVPAIGASGAIAGVLGAYLINFPRARIKTIVIGVWALSQFVHGFGTLSEHVASEQGGTAYFAHIGGFSAGVITIGWFAMRRVGARR